MTVVNNTSDQTGTFTVSHGGNASITSTGNAGYILDSVTADGVAASLTSGAYTFLSVGTNEKGIESGEGEINIDEVSD